MKRIFIPFFSLILLLTGCSSAPEKTAPLIVVSVPPYVKFVEIITQNKFDIKAAITSERNPHTYEPPPREIKQLENASIWIGVGEPFEKKMIQVLSDHNPNLRIVNLSKEIALPHTCFEGCHHHHGEDLHIWMSPKLAKEQAKVIAKTLIAQFPDEKENFEEGLNTLLSKLDTLDQNLTEILKPFKGDAILVSHPAFGYFCNAYDLLQISIECEGKAPKPRDLEHILHEAKHHHARCVLLQVQFNTQGGILIAKELDLPYFEANPLAEDYFSNLQHIGELIAGSH